MVGKRLAELRTKKNMTQEEFADYMGVTRQSVSKWELDKTFPDVEKLIRISELYDVSVDYILKGVEPIKEVEVVEEILVETEVASEEGIVDSSKENSPVIKKRTGLIVGICITAVFIVTVLVFIGNCLIHNNWLNDDKNTPVRVEKVYEQLSLVEVRVYDKYGDYISDTMLLDIEGIRPGDYIYTKVEDNNISVSYGTDTLIVLGMLTILLIIMLVIQVKELGKYE